MDSDALELALGLYRMPTRRFELLSRPLPGGIDAVLQLASGNQPQLREAAASSGETEQTVLDAVRFYLQQVLFQPDADAYRVLGLAANAEPETIHRHYRWLQSWLHPDRHGDEWEALLATRVNWAWRHLRTEAARSKYAAEGEALASSGLGTDASLGTVEWIPVSPTPRPGRWSWRIALGVLGSFLGLLVLGLTLRDTNILDEFAPSDTERGRGLLEGQIKPAESEPVEPERARESPLAAHIEQVSAMAAAPDATSSVEQQPPISIAVDEPVRVAVTLTPPSLPVVADIRPPPVVTIKPTWPAANDVVAPIQTVAKGDLSRADDIRAAVVPVESRRVGVLKVSRHDSLPEAARTPSAAPPRSIDAIPSEEAAAASPSDRVPDTTVTNRPGPPVAQQESAAQAEPDASIHSEGELARLDLARQRIGEVAAYLGNARLQTPPVWNDVRGQMDAEQQRAALLERNRSRAAGDFEVEMPNWRMSKDTAALSADYHLHRGRSVTESGRIVMDMIWREKMWLVTRVELSPGR